jgi:WD40 repeat protein
VPGGTRLQGHTHAINSLAFSDDARHVWTASLDGSTRLWDRVTGKERCCLYSLDEGKDWLVVTPVGHFDGSEGAWKYIAYRESGGLKLHDDDATRKKFHRPGLLAEVWKGK